VIQGRKPRSHSILILFRNKTSPAIVGERGNSL
jgi:hypothetical protein